MKIAQALEYSNILFKGVAETIRNEKKRIKRWLLRNTGWHFRINLAIKFFIRERNCKCWLWK